MRLPSLKQTRLAFLVFFVGALSFAASSVYANVTVTPTLIMIEGRDRYADVSLINTGDIVKSYEMRWRFFAMQESTGLYQEREGSTTDFDLSQHIVFTPRKVTLGPQQPQKIRLGLRLKGEPPPPGDYRAHMEFMSEKRAPNVSKKPGEKGAPVAIGINVGFSIPVVYRVGESDAVATIGDITTRINEKRKAIEALVPVTRSGGPFGIIGRMVIYHDDKIVGEVKNANIFPEISQRVFKIILSTDQLAAGTLKAVYYGVDKHKDEIFAEKTMRIGG